MKKIITIILMVTVLGALNSCKTVEKDPAGNAYKVPEKYNLKVTCYDTEISNPGNDRRSYYKIYIDKVEEGRTTTGLESQEKTYQGKLSVNRHVLAVEKWVIDPREGRYIKLNNIDQPKPNFVYFSLPRNRVLNITMKSGKNNKAEFAVDFEMED